MACKLPWVGSVFILSILLFANPIRADEVTEEEKELVAKLRPLVKDLIYKDFMNTDEYLVRFLRQVDFDMDKAVEKVQKTMAWRKENKIDTIISEDFSFFEKHFPMDFSSFDKKGHPVGIFHLGRLDIRRIILTGKKKQFYRYFDRTLEIMQRMLHESPANVSTAFIILDLSGVNLKQHGCLQCIDLVPYIFRTYEAYYPDRLYKYYGINIPNFYIPILNTIKAALDVRTQKTITFFNNDKDAWKKALLAEIDKNQLATRYGGVLPLTRLEKSFKEQSLTNPLLAKVLAQKS